MMKAIGTIIGACLLVSAGLCLVPPASAIQLTFTEQQALVLQKAELRQAEELYRAGRAEEALSQLRGFVVRYFDSPLLPPAYLLISRIFLDGGQPDEALLYLGRIPPEGMVPEVRLLEGAALVVTGKAEAGVAILEGLAGAEFTGEDEARRLSALTEGRALLGEPLRALLFIHQKLSGADPGQQSKLLEQAHLLLQDRAGAGEVAEAAFMFQGTALGADANLQLARLAALRGDAVRARELVRPLLQGVPFPYRSEAVQLWEELTGEAFLQRAVGVLLPLSGRYRAFGELVRRGMDLALETHHGDQPPPRFIFRDTGGDALRGVEALDELANGERVMAAIGPLTGGAAAEAAVRAQLEDLPLLALSQREGLAEAGDVVFRNSLTSRLQVQTLVRHAMDEGGTTTFGILYPENKLGLEMTDLFTEAVLERGGQVVALEGYPAQATDFRRQIKLLMGLDPDAPDEEAEPASEAEMLEGLFLPDTPSAPFEALFIPDYADRVGLIAPQLAFYGIEDLLLLGINGWNSPELTRIAGSYVEGSIFVDGFFRFSPYPFVREFVDLYFQKYGEEPSILEAQGFDAAGILLSLLDRPEVISREDVRAALSALRNYPGVTGATSFGPSGDADKVLFLLQVQNGNIVQIN
ncbi:penicillin-binding protein activator [uncultured Desulfuromonas sp.]|uniref:penicillin-binding protein activator n=1 Tax=uncultured Desulfuromonas sp. TaxID=181013 RepID=UPI0026224656|nr:penicillin-binding protein activator [uncultured Desulfuromonas sp.]